MSSGGIFSDWMVIWNNTWFVTRSPYPELPYYFSDPKLPKCENTSLTSSNLLIGDITDYLKIQIYILRYNNPKHSIKKIKRVIKDRISNWKGNEILKKDPFYLGDLLDKIIEECFEDENYVEKIDFKCTKHWYSDQILKQSGIGRSSSQRFKSKSAARHTYKVEMDYLEKMKIASEVYKKNNYNVLPTSRWLSEETSISERNVKKYGLEFFISHGDNIRNRVLESRKLYTEYTQQQIADLLNEKKRTIRQYWGSV